MVKSAMQELLDIIESEVGLTGTCADEPDDQSIGWDGDGKPLPMTFGHIRRARAEADAVAAKEGQD
jgi:hypothetical protein